MQVTHNEDAASEVRDPAATDEVADVHAHLQRVLALVPGEVVGRLNQCVPVGIWTILM